MEKTILTNVVEIGATSIEFSSPVRVQLAAFPTNLTHWLLYHNNDTDVSINMCWRKRKIKEKGLAAIH